MKPWNNALCGILLLAGLGFGNLTERLETRYLTHDMSVGLVGKTTDVDPGSKGWYRKRFTLSADATGKRANLRFDGVYHWWKVW